MEGFKQECDTVRFTFWKDLTAVRRMAREGSKYLQRALGGPRVIGWELEVVMGLATGET